MTQYATPGIFQHLDPRQWRVHRFGLSVARWVGLRDKSFWITGAGTGYGRCIALALAAAQAQVFISGRRAEKLAETCAQAATLDIDPAYLISSPLDICDGSAVQRTAEAIGRRTSNLYGLVNSAALPPPPNTWPFADVDLDTWNRLISTNVTGQWLASKAALPLMAGNTGYRIVFMTSDAGWAFTSGFGPYNVSKAAVNNLGASLAEECATRFADKDVQINVLVPGEARTEMNQGSDEDPFSVVCMTLALLSHPVGGPNGCFFHRDGRHLSYAYACPFPRSLFEDDDVAVSRKSRKPRGGWGLGQLLRMRGRRSDTV